MLYSNRELKAVERKFDFGTIYQVCLGEVGRGRRLMALTCPEGTIVHSGMNEELTIGTTKSGRARINARKGNQMYMLLSSEGGYTRRGCGTIQVLTSQEENFEVLSRGNGADGDAGRIGSWDCMLLRAPITDAIIKVRTSGAGYGTPSDLYLIHDSSVYHCYLDNLEECCEALNIPVPCKLELDVEGHLRFGDDWTVL